MKKTNLKLVAGFLAVLLLVLGVTDYTGVAYAAEANKITASGNSTSGNAVSDNTVSDNTVSDNTVSINGITVLKKQKIDLKALNADIKAAADAKEIKKVYAVKDGDAKAGKKLVAATKKAVITGKKAGQVTVVVEKKDGTKIEVPVTVLELKFDDSRMQKNKLFVTVSTNTVSLNQLLAFTDGVSNNNVKFDNADFNENAQDVDVTYKLKKIGKNGVDKNCVTVSANGEGMLDDVFCVNRNGNIKVTYTVKSNDIEKSKPVKMTATICVKIPALNVKNGKVELKANKSKKVSVKNLVAGVNKPSKKDAKYNIVWDSSNKAAATVDEKGKITAVAAGTTTITATLADGNVLSCEVTVK